jgi:hypothetical protein
VWRGWSRLTRSPASDISLVGLGLKSPVSIAIAAKYVILITYLLEDPRAAKLAIRWMVLAIQRTITTIYTTDNHTALIFQTLNNNTVLFQQQCFCYPLITVDVPYLPFTHF